MGSHPRRWRSSGGTSNGKRVVLVERTCAYGVTKSYGKTAVGRRRVSLSSRALDALDVDPRRLDVGLGLPGRLGESAVGGVLSGERVSWLRYTAA
jgi:hypothetical protein